MGKLWRSRIFHEPCSDGRERDIFPLPLLENVASVQGNVCRAVQRRIHRKSAIVTMVNRAISSLNSLYFGRQWDGGRTTAKLDDLPLAQKDCVRDLIRRVGAFGPMPSGASRQGALQALRAPSSGYIEPIAGVGEVTGMKLDLLSLPSGRVAGVNLSESLEQPLKDMVDFFEDWMLQDAPTWSSICDEAQKIKPYNDPSLSDRSTYLKFLSHLNKCGILGHTTVCRGRVGAFCVTKKPKEVNGVMVERQRLILDCRQVNLAFREPPRCELGSLAALCEVELRQGETLFCGGSDIQDCFYAARISDELSNFFCLSQDISPQEAIEVFGCDFQPNLAYQQFSPCITVLPMGFSWSFYLIQKLHEQSALRSLGIGREHLILDGYPAPYLSSDQAVAMPYCDNVHSLSLSRTVADDGLQRMQEDLAGMGFTLHEEVDSTSYFQTLGGIIDGEAGQIRSTPSRAWNILLAFEECLVAKVGWQFIQKLLGHAITICVLNRAGMSIFRALYDFVEYKGEARFLNRLERREVEIFIGLIPLLVGDLRRPWSSTVHCSDASPEGYGICSRELPDIEVRELGSWQDRWRFKHLDPAEWRPRQRFSGLDPLRDMCTARSFPVSTTVEDLYSYNNHFPEVPEKVMNPEEWNTVLMGRWRDKTDHITAKEGHSLVLVARRLCRASRNRNKRHLVLVDSFALSMTMCKGRASNFGMLRTAQKVAALSLAGGFTLRTRWVPSEVNVADGPSRGQIKPGPLLVSKLQTSLSKDNRSAARGGPVETEEGEYQDFDQSQFAIAASTTSQQNEEEDFDGNSYDTFPNSQEEKDPTHRRCFDSGSRESSSSQWTQSPREEVGFKGGGKPVRQSLREVQDFLPRFRCGQASRVAARRPSDGLSGFAFSGKSACHRRRKNYGQRGVPSYQGEGSASPDSQSIAGVEKRKASRKQSAHAQADSVWACHDHAEGRQENNGSEDFGGFRHIHAARREHRFEEQTLGSTGQEGRRSIPVALHHCAGLRRSSSRQSGNLRQHYSSEHSRKEVVRPKPSGLDAGQGQGAEDFSLHHGGVPEELQLSFKQAGTPSASSIPAEARRSSRRPGKQNPGICSCESKRQVEHGPECSQIHKNRQDPSTFGAIVTRRSGVLSMVTQKHAEGRSRATSAKEFLKQPWEEDVFSLTDLPSKFALEIFSGTSRICMELNRLGILCYPIDICLFSHHDVLCTDVEHKIFNWIRAGKILFIWCGMPCTTFSRARKWDGLGPGPLRTSAEMWGRSGLSISEFRKVQLGNLLFRWSIRMMYLCISYYTPFVLENPLSSLAWDMAPMRKLISRFHLQCVHLDYCQFGELWKKPTCLLYYGLDISSLNKRCNTHRGKCSRTKRPHIALVGLDADGHFMTLKAQPYPYALCKQLGQCLAKALQARGWG